MGQPIAVTARPGLRPEVMHFEINRSLTGMQTERYASPEAARLPDAELVVLPDCDHVANFGRIDVVLPAVSAFLARVAAYE